MSRLVPFDSEEKCDFCDNIGAYDFMGDFLCIECYQDMMDAQGEDDLDDDEDFDDE
jgi:hypothetical protein